MAVREQAPAERTKSPDELAAEKIETAVRNHAAERYSNPETSLLRGNGAAGVKMPRFADGFPIPARNIPYLISVQSEHGYSSGRWLKKEDLEYLGVSESDLKGEPTHLISWNNSVYEAQRDENGKLVPNERYGGYQTEAKQISERKRVIATPVWNLDQTPLVDAPATEPQQEPTLNNVWNVLHNALTQKGIKIEARSVPDPALCRIARTADNDPTTPGTILVGLNPDMEVDHVIYHAMQALDLGLDVQAPPADRRRSFGDETEARVRMATAIVSLALQEKLPESYPPNGDAALGQWEQFIAEKADNKGRMFGFMVSGPKSRGAADNLYMADLIPRGAQYSGESLFSDAEGGGGSNRTAAWTDTYDAETARIFGIETGPAADAGEPAAGAPPEEGHEGEGRDVPF